VEFNKKDLVRKHKKLSTHIFQSRLWLYVIYAFRGLFLPSNFSQL
jgi:hypothetical protein